MHKLLKRVVEAIQEKLKMSVWATRTESSACDEKSETELERKYNSEFRETLVSLERKLHTTEDPSAITMEALKMVCAFHDADWAGILIVDRSAEMWSPAMWYGRLRHRAGADTARRERRHQGCRLCRGHHAHRPC